MVIGTSGYPTSLDAAADLIIASNEAATTIDVGGASNSATTINVVSASTANSAGGTAVIVDANDDSIREIVTYTGKSGNTITGVVRNFESSGNKPWPAGAKVYFDMATARHHNVLVDAAIALMTKVGIGTGSPTSGKVLMGSGAGSSSWTTLVAAHVSDFASAVSALLPAPYVEPTGMIKQWLDGTIPTGYLELNGQAVSRTTYSALFALYGTKYGVGNGSTTFELPNLKGRTMYGYDSANTKFDTIGETGGAETVTLTADESGVPAHNHAAGTLAADSNGAHTHNVDLTVANAAVGPNIPSWRNGGASATTSNGAHVHTISGTTANNSAASASAAHQNLPPYFTGKWIVKT